MLRAQLKLRGRQLADGRGSDVVSPIIVTRDNVEAEALPFYIRQHQVIVVKDDVEILTERIEEQLMRTREESQTPVWKSWAESVP